MRNLLKPVSTLLIALSLTLGMVAVASAQDEPDPTEIGLFCPDPACPADACGIIANSYCTWVLTFNVFTQQYVWKCKCKTIVG